MFSAYHRQPDGRIRERFGLSWEDFAPGQRFRHRPGVTLTQQDNVDEALDTMNAAMIHYDDHYAGKTAWERPLMVSTVTLQRVVGMGSKTFGRRRAILGFDEIAMTAPVFGGDTLYAETEVLETEAGPDPDVGRLHLRASGLKPDGTVVARIRLVAEVWRRGRGPDADVGPAIDEPRFAAFRTEADGTLVEQTGLFFEEFREGETFVHSPRRTFFRDEAVSHAWRSMEWSPAFHDLGWIDRHQGGRYRIPETFVLTASVTPSTRVFGRVVANLGWTDVRFPVPVFAGDTVEAASTIMGVRASRSRPAEGILTVETRATNQHGAAVVTFRRNLLVYRRDAANPYAEAGY